MPVHALIPQLCGQRCGPQAAAASTTIVDCLGISGVIQITTRALTWEFAIPPVDITFSGVLAAGRSGPRLYEVQSSGWSKPLRGSLRVC